MYVIYFHSIGNERDTGFIRYLSVSAQQFERFCEFLSSQNYQTRYLDDWYEFVSMNRKKCKKQYVLTLDDGYLDNWVYAYPILKKYGLKGTIFINPEFIDPSTSPRPNLEDVGFDAAKLRQEETVGFLNWAEIEAMHRSGIIDIQSHSMSHDFYFRSDKIVDIYDGQERMNWMAWMNDPVTKPFYLSPDYDCQKSFGNPVFEFGRALALRKYIPDDRIIRKGKELFRQGVDKHSIISELNSLKVDFPGRYETDAEMEERYRYELFESKSILEKRLGKQVDFLCWPGGGFNELSVKLSKEAGYKASTLGSGLSEKFIDNNKDYKRIPRFGLGSVIKINCGVYHVRDKDYLIQLFKAQTGNLPLKALLKIKRELIRKIRSC